MELNTGAQVLRASCRFTGTPATGHVLAKHKCEWVVWHVYRYEQDGVWQCQTGSYFPWREGDHAHEQHMYDLALECYRERAFL